MAKILDRIDALARRCGDLSPIGPGVKRIVEQGNREMFLAGREDTGGSVRPLAASTLKRRKGSGPRGVPHGESSRAISGLVVSVEAGPGRLAIGKTWPSFPEVYHLGRTVGYREQDLQKIRTALRDFVIDGKR